ncbi:type III-B CRISPR module-associated protein Cmr3 [Paenibacillus peoriae]|uniref:type III-B CRISPR module-associated protein Cmr3 n=1 Tax=Paenibacillus peoriae TaxID=59893 RepID=UPI00215A37CA|nr:type III-B CRISPR module-associated protein Cmr3 [Paenibacillus peoriae]
MKKRLQVKPLDPIMVRDGRPFSATPGIRAHTLSDVTPSMLAGTIRTMLAKREQAQEGKSSLSLNHFSKLNVRGPIYKYRESLYFAMPQDAEMYEEHGEASIRFIRPVNLTGAQHGRQGFFGVGQEGRLADVLWPPLGAGTHKGMKEAPAYISKERMVHWLAGTVPEETWSKLLNQWRLDQKNNPLNAACKTTPFLPAFIREERTHTAIDPKTYTAKEQQLFSTESLVFPPEFTVEAEIDLGEHTSGCTGKISEMHPMGGKRRLAHFSEVKDDLSWTCPVAIQDSMQGASYIRMVLATPAYFRKGWLPGWLDENLQTKNPWKCGVELQLRWACVPRWQPVSGWSYSKDSLSNEKAVRRMVPAGSVYFFEVIKGDAADLAKEMWLQSVSDTNRRKEAFDKEDGYGLALWGKWNITNTPQMNK